MHPDVHLQQQEVEDWEDAQQTHPAAHLQDPAQTHPEALLQQHEWEEEQTHPDTHLQGAEQAHLAAH